MGGDECSAGVTDPVERGEQGIIGQGDDRREVALGDEAGARTGDRLQRVRDGIVGDEDAEAIDRREISGGGMKRIAVKKDRETGRAFRGNDAACFQNPGEGGFADFVFQVGGERGQPRFVGAVERGILFFRLEVDSAELVRPGDEQKRSVEIIDGVEKDDGTEDVRRGHRILLQPIKIVLMPLPLVAIKTELGVDFELMHIDLAAEQLSRRHGHAFEAREPRKNLACLVCGENSADRAIFFQNAPRLIDSKLAICLVLEQLDLGGREPLLDDEEAVLMEGVDLGRAESG